MASFRRALISSGLQSNRSKMCRMAFTWWDGSADLVGDEYFLQNRAAFVDEFVAQVQSRQQPEHRPVRTVDEQLSLQAAGDDGAAFDGQLQADHGTLDPNFLDQGTSFAQILEAIAEALADPVGL